MKKKIVFILICFMTLSIFPMITVNASNKKSDYDYVQNFDEFYEVMAKDCLDFEKQATYCTTLDLSNFSFDRLTETVSKYDRLVGGCLYKITWETKQKDQLFYTTVYYTYYISKSEHEKICKMAKDIASDLKSYTDYQKIKIVHDYLIDRNNYNIGSDGPYRALYKSQANCNGYALAFLSIMRECNIDCTYETGDNHAWNSVKLDNEWYNIDVTWDDSGVWDDEGGIHYNYFLKCNSDWEGHHHGNSTAKTSYNSDLTFTKSLKDYATHYKVKKIITFAIIIFLLAGGYFLYKKYKRKKDDSFENQNNISLSNNEYLDEDITCLK